MKTDSISEEFYTTDAMVNLEWMRAEYELRHVVTRFAIYDFTIESAPGSFSTRPAMSVYVHCVVNGVIFTMPYNAERDQFL